MIDLPAKFKETRRYLGANDGLGEKEQKEEGAELCKMTPM